SKINFTVTATDAHIVNVTIKSNYSSTQYLMTRGAANKWYISTTPATLGCPAGGASTACRLTARATDVVRNKNSTNYTITIDDQAPSVANLDSSDTDEVARSDVVLNFTVEVSDTNLANVTLKSNFSSALHFMGQGAGNLWSYASTLAALNCNAGAANSPCKVTVTATDVTDKKTSVNLVVYLDDVFPLIWSLKTNQSDNVSRSNFPLNFTVFVSDANIRNVTLRNGTKITSMKLIGSSKWSTVNTSAQINCPTGQPNAPCTFTAHVIDKAGNVNTTTYTISLDDVFPKIFRFFSNQTDNISNTRDILRFYANASDVHLLNVTIYSNPAQVKVLMNPQTALNISWTALTNLSRINAPPNQASMNFTVFARVVDAASNQNITNYTIVIDDIPPAVWDLNASNAQIIFGVPTTSPEIAVNWRVNSSDAHFINVTLGIQTGPQGYLTVERRIPKNGSSKTIYNLSITPLASHNATNGTYTFRATGRDRASNFNYSYFNLKVGAAVPVVDDIYTEGGLTYVEINYDTIRIIANITAFDGYRNYSPVILTVVKPNGTKKNYDMFNITPILPNETYWAYDYSTDKVGWHNVSVYGYNTFGSYGPTFDRNLLFQGIGKTTGNVFNREIACGSCNPATFNSSTNLTRFVNITQANAGYFILKSALNNTGLINMHNAIVQISVVGPLPNFTGVYDCYDLSNGTYCALYVNYTISVTTGTGVKDIFAIGAWKDADNTFPESISKRHQVEIEQNTVLQVVESIFNNHQLVFNKTTLLGNFTVYAFGNTGLSAITYSLRGGTVTSKNINFSPTNIASIAVANTRGVQTNVRIPSRGHHNVTVIVNATGSICIPKSECVDTFLINVTVFDSLNITRSLPVSRIYNRSETVVPFSCQVLSEHNKTALPAVSGYTVSYSHNKSGTSIGTNITNSAGIATFSWNITYLTPGSYMLNCSIQENLANFYHVNRRTSNVSVFVYGRLNISAVRTVNNVPIYFFDTRTPFNTTFTATVVDENYMRIAGAAVSYYSNATQSRTYEKIGTCATNSTGQCNFVWNPTVESVGNFSVRYNASKPYYYTPPLKSRNVTIIGQQNIQILQPVNKTIFFFNYNPPVGYNLIAELRDENGTLQPIINPPISELNWSLENSTVARQIAATNTWFINSSNRTYQRGFFNLTLRAQSGARQLYDMVSVYIFDKVMVTNLTTSTQSTGRVNALVSLTAQVRRESNNSIVRNYTCSWYDFNGAVQVFLANTSTNMTGHCNYTWRIYETDAVGNHTLRVVLQNDTSHYYAAKSGLSMLFRVVRLTETLNASIVRPNGSRIFHKGQSVVMNTSIRNAYGTPLSTAVANWSITNRTLNRSLFNGGYYHIWEIPSNYTLGNFTLRLRTSLINYWSDADSYNMSIFGYSQVDYISPLNLSLDRGKNIIIRCRVSDTLIANVSKNAIKSYPVTFWIKNAAGGVLVTGTNTTNTNGYASFIFNTSNNNTFLLGPTTLGCNITHNEGLFYNASQAFQDNHTLTLMDYLDLSFNISANRTYRDEQFNMSLPHLINLSFAVGDGGVPQNDSLVEFFVNGFAVASCVTNETGFCTYTWNPSHLFSTFGTNTVYAHALKQYYYSSQNVSRLVTIRVHSRPYWEFPKGTVDFNVSTNDYVLNMSCLAKESVDNETIHTIAYPMQMWFVDPIYPKYADIRGELITHYSNNNT
ncbi:hypothetical protein COY95_04905, partial [Candidatus Woesearchaeota archaeon CG_4_10_14_0_8_um_filter_47_5]